MSMDAIKDTFFTECADQLAELENGLFEIDADDPDSEIVNSVFRAVHSIKGGAGAFGLDDLVRFAHIFENALDVIRQDTSQSNGNRITLLMRASDVLSDVVAISRDGGDMVDFQAIAGELESEFELENEEDQEEVEFVAVPMSIEDIKIGPVTAGKSFQITFKPLSSMYLNGHDPQRLFRSLAELGEIEALPQLEELPTLDDLDVGNWHLSWIVNLATDSDEEDIAEVFDWVEGSCEISIEQTGSGSVVEQEPLDIDAVFAGLEDLPDIGSEDDDPDASSIEETASVEIEPIVLDADASDVTENVSDEEKQEPVPEKEAAEANSAPQKTAQKKSEPAKRTSSIRVESDKVDKLINLMGELVINQSMLNLQVNEAGFGAASPTGLALVELQNLTREIQSSVMSIRAQPIKPVFMRMSRVVREVSGATGKKAKLVFNGENTEVDTTVIEGLSDPLTHMIRNSVDHGVESAEKRAELGKPEEGTIELTASHSSGSIVIEVRDDGAGINREKVREIAVDRGIIQPDAKLSDEETDNLIFAAGFSTATEVTDVSGRGVGMDVVRQSIQSLGGRVTISSTPGKGSTFTLNLPLTLAILDGMLVRTSKQMFVIPITSVIETIGLKPGDVYNIGKSQRAFKLRDQLVPIIDIAYELGFADKRSDFTAGTVLIVESSNNTLCAFLVESIVGQQQVVIKSMEANYQKVPCIAAATILGNGRIALILDIEQIFDMKLADVSPYALLEESA